MTPRALTGERAFTTLWLGQIVSVIGSGLTSFVLGVWVFQRTGRVTDFALIAACASLPAVLAGPFVGALVDRWNRRWTMAVADTCAGLCTATAGLLLFAGRLEVWHIFAVTALSSLFGAFQSAAYSSAIPLLVPEKRLGRVNGMVQTGNAVQIISPAVAGVLVAAIGVEGVIAIDFATYLVASATLLAVRIPKPAVTEAGMAAAGSLLREAAAGWRWLRGRPGLMGLMVVFGIANFFIGIASVTVQPLILGFASPAVLGTLMLAGGSGMLAGGVAMSAWGGPKRRIHGVLGFLALGGAALFLHALAPSPWLIAVVAPAFLFTVPFVGGSAMTILQLRTPPDLLGRVMATAQMLATAAMPAAYFAAGPLADRVFNPAMMPGGSLAGTLGPWIGAGPGRGIALMFALAGAACIATAAAGYLSPALRAVDDGEPATEPAAAAEPALALETAGAD
jgi:MFS family permease